MHIKEILDYNRRDFHAIYICEHCNAQVTSHGYDDDNFHKNVIPAMVCKSCGKAASSSYVPRKPRYSPDQIV